MPVCDVCNREVQWEDCYALTTVQVVYQHDYWVKFFSNPQFTALRHMDSVGGAARGLAVEQAAQDSGWLVCPSCATMFTFEKAIASACARERKNPPGSGTADASKTIAAALKAWKGLL